MKTLTQFIYEAAAVKMNPAKLAEYKKLIAEYKKLAEEHGLKLIVQRGDTTKTLWLSSQNLDALENFANAGDSVFHGLKEEKWPLPYTGCDAHIIDDDTPEPILYFCMWLGLGPCENPQEQYAVAYETYGAPDNDMDDMHQYWVEAGYDDPDKFLEALIGQVKDIMTIFPEYKVMMEEEY